jgi:hypothetical protein
VQSANFVFSGVMVIAAALGIARVVGRGGRATNWSLVSYGACMPGAAILRADPVDGVP